MTENKVIETLQDIHDVAECRIKNGDQRGVVYIPQDKLQDFNITISALMEIQQYREYKRIFEEHMSKTTIGVLSDKKEFSKWMDRIAWNLKRCDELYYKLEQYKKLGTVEELREAGEKQRWIPCSDRLPEEKINPVTSDFYEYQVTFKSDDVTDIRHYKFGRGHWWNGGGIMDRYVIAWLPLPERYQSKTELEVAKG